MVVAAVVLVGELALAVGGAAELAAPDDQGVVEHAALLEVLDEGRAGLVDVLALGLVLLGEVVVGVPAAVEDLDVAHPAFGEAAGVEAAGGEGARLAGLLAVELEGRVALARRGPSAPGTEVCMR